MAPTVSVLIANRPGKVVETPYRIHEPIFFLLERLASQLGLEIQSPSQHRLAINGFHLGDDKKSLEDYRIYGSTLTYTFWDKNSLHFYVKTLAGKTLVMHCHPSDSVEDLKRRIQDHQGTPVNQQHLTFAGNPLDNDMSLYGYGIVNDSTVHMIPRLRGGYELPSLVITFADVANEGNVRKLEFSTNAPPGRSVLSGTNVECRCECTPDYLVICPKQFGIIELTEARFVCPNCNQSNRIVPVTVGFTKCQYRFMGIKTNGEQYNSGWINVPPEDMYQVFNPSKQASWRRLMIQSKYLDELDDCVVCLRSKHSVKAFSCGHYFHEECFFKVGCCFICKFDKQLKVAVPHEES